MSLNGLNQIRLVDGTTWTIDSSCDVGVDAFGDIESLVIQDKFEHTFIPMDKIVALTFTNDISKRVNHDNFEAIDVLEDMLHDYGPYLEEYPEIANAIGLAQKVLREQAEETQ